MERMQQSTHIHRYPHTFNAVIPVLLSLYAVGMAAFNEGVYTSLNGFRNLIWPCWYPRTLLLVERLGSWKEERLATWCATSQGLCHTMQANKPGQSGGRLSLPLSCCRVPGEFLSIWHEPWVGRSCREEMVKGRVYESMFQENMRT